MTKRTQTEPAARWFASEWTDSLARVLGERLGKSPRVERVEPLPGRAPSGLLWWAQSCGDPPRPAIWIGIGENDCPELMGQSQSADDEFRQAIGETFGRLSRASGPAEASDGPPLTAETIAVDLAAGAAAVRIYIAVEEDAIERLSLQEPTPVSDTLELLLDLELPVSVSFGKVQMTFQDVLKLTTGSIIELNRSVDDPVDIVVNEQVIASGEVVVVNGNYGVRIQRLASRAARLRSADAALVARGMTAGVL